MVYLFITGPDHPSLQETFGKRGTCNSPAAQLNLLFHLPMEKTHWFLFWGFHLDMSDNTWFSVFFSNMTSTALLHHPFSVIRMGNCQRTRGKGKVVSLPVQWKKLLWIFAFFSMVCKDCLVLFLHMANGWEGKRKELSPADTPTVPLLAPPCGLIAGPHLPHAQGGAWCQGCPVAPAPGWSCGTGAALLPWAGHSPRQLQGSPPGSHCWHAGSYE